MTVAGSAFKVPVVEKDDYGCAFQVVQEVQIDRKNRNPILPTFIDSVLRRRNGRCLTT